MNPDATSLGLELASVVQHRRELLFLVDETGSITWLGPEAQRWLGPAATTSRLVDLTHPDDADDLRAAFAGFVEGEPGLVELTCRVRHLDGDWRRLELTLSDGRRRPGIGAIVCVGRDRGHEAVTADLLHRATHDSLTALPNRASLLDQLHAPVEGGDTASFAVLYVDLDGFKQVNDTLGHAAGDRVLVAVADRLRRAVRPGDSVARIGGDEFVVVADGVTDGAVAVEIGRRVVSNVCRPIAVGGRLVGVGASVGASVGRRERALALLDEADRAMYRAKREGRNRCALYDRELDGAGSIRVRNEELIRSALDQDGAVVVYQPIVDLSSGRLCGVDAGLRLRGPEGELVTPDAFLGLAEETGLSVALGAGLADLACAQQRRWLDELGGTGPELLTLPVSGRQLADGSLAARLAATVARHGLDPAQLCLAVPEAVLAGSDSATTRVIEHLKALGASIAVDDFGVGRSSLPYLRRFGVDALRLDATFADDLDEGGDQEVVAAIVALGVSLGMTVVAKGVDRPGQVAPLVAAGCHLGIGRHLGAPALPGDLPSLTAGRG